MATTGFADGVNYDVDGDGKVTIMDAVMVLKHIENGYNSKYDLNSDGSVNIMDAVAILKYQAQIEQENSLPDYVEEALSLINAEREKRNVPALTTSTDMVKAAEVCAKEVAKYYSTDRPDGSSGFSVLDEYDVYYVATRASILKYVNSVNEAVEIWLNDLTTLSADYNRIAIGRSGDSWAMFLINQKEYQNESYVVSEDKFVSEVVRLTNIERAKQGLCELTTTSDLLKAADIRAKECDNYYDHTRPDGTLCFSVLNELGISYGFAAENIAQGQRTPAQVVDDWMNSPGHRANIMNADLNKIGVGYSSVSHSWVQLFTN